MRKSTGPQWVIRIVSYIIGLLLLAFGVTLSANAALGISPVNSLPFILGDIFGIDSGKAVTALFCFYILLQIIILRKDFKPINLLQIVFSTIFGYFVSFTKSLVGPWKLPGYAGSLVMLAVSLVFIAIGMFIYVDTEIVPMPMEGLTMTLASKLGKEFPKVKTVVDCVIVAIGLALSFFILGNAFERIREGTVITAICVGPMIAFLRKHFSKRLKQLYFGKTENE